MKTEEGYAFDAYTPMTDEDVGRSSESTFYSISQERGHSGMTMVSDALNLPPSNHRLLMMLELISEGTGCDHSDEYRWAIGLSPSKAEWAFKSIGEHMDRLAKEKTEG